MVFMSKALGLRSKQTKFEGSSQLTFNYEVHIKTTRAPLYIKILLFSWQSAFISDHQYKYLVTLMIQGRKIYSVVDDLAGSLGKRATTLGGLAFVLDPGVRSQPTVESQDQ